MSIINSAGRSLFLMFLASLSLAQGVDTSKPDPGKLESHLDPVAEDLMRRLYAPGMAVAVVKDGKVILKKGYGFSNVESKTPVDPSKTIFRIGSITKVFTANAALILEEEGKIGLDTDVKKYLNGLKIGGAYKGVMTVRNLLTHTSGLDEFSAGRRSETAAGVKPLKDFLSDRLVARTEPGRQISYSTYGITLAGYIVEDISGQPLSKFFEDSIFRPLEMNSTNLGVVPESRKNDLAVGYTFNGQYNPQPFEYFHTYPASDINSTADDMANYILAHLGGGRFKGNKVFDDSTSGLMHHVQFKNHERLPGWAVGFYETYDNNLKGIEHGGSMEGFAALLYLLPEKDLGIFVASNIEQGRLMSGMKQAVLDYFYPVSSSPDDPEEFAKLKRFEGRYRWDVYCHTCPPDSRGFFPRPFEVTLNNDSTISFFGNRWKPVGHLTFKAILNDDREIFAAFKEDESGNITFLFHGSNAYERVAEEAK
ncbi:MAG: class A beta-lactamase-related serine hydrolase [Acidobacteria bacterium]|nr:MAG: class A beta-lactamase-related serine hydrolase [Acidobacteriota bacterium]REK02664.1 MAG: class A beta-lactamase-related serine hydrolase [Acidobacteriota bacterium]REK13531.1 MAG: class A beta-lactamase-related serine hydrolase [Acidobacteriota bacterium]REK41525.1 MAG: class A beta-lactamase-related serine hydrolase [Acidobacteriota bacterium]